MSRMHSSDMDLYADYAGRRAAKRATHKRPSPTPRASRSSKPSGGQKLDDKQKKMIVGGVAIAALAYLFWPKTASASSLSTTGKPAAGVPGSVPTRPGAPVPTGGVPAGGGGAPAPSGGGGGYSPGYTPSPTVTPAGPTADDLSGAFALGQAQGQADGQRDGSSGADSNNAAPTVYSDAQMQDQYAGGYTAAYATAYSTSLAGRSLGGAFGTSGSPAPGGIGSSTASSASGAPGAGGGSGTASPVGSYTGSTSGSMSAAQQTGYNIGVAKANVDVANGTTTGRDNPPSATDYGYTTIGDITAFSTGYTQGYNSINPSGGASAGGPFPYALVRDGRGNLRRVPIRPTMRPMRAGRPWVDAMGRVQWG